MNERKIFVAFSPDSQTQLLQTVDWAALPTPVTAKMLIEWLDWDTKYPDILSYDIGVFSQKIAWDTPLKAGDRLEIYRPLLIDPMRKRQLIMTQRQKMLNKQRAKNNIAKKLVDKKALFDTLRAEQAE